jgi:hypothetical protein
MPAAGHSCPHCGTNLSRLGLNDAMFDHDFDYACFNDDCPYYTRGWVWMEQQYGVKASYRYRLDAVRGFESPLPVRSPGMFRSALLEEHTP